MTFLAFKFFIAPLPIIKESILLCIVYIFFFAAIIIGSIYSAKSFERIKWRMISAKYWLLTSSLALVSSFFCIFLWKNNILNLLSNFISGTRLLLNIPFYSLLLSRVEFVNIPQISALTCIASIPIGMYILREKRITCLAVSAFVYLVMAGISIRYAYYYNHIFILLNISLIILFFFYLGKITDSLLTRTILFFSIVLICVSAFISFDKNNQTVFNRHPTLKNIEEITSYVNSNTKINDKLLVMETEYLTLYMYVPRTYIFISGVSNSQDYNYLDAVRSEIAEKGFYNTMKENNVRYLLTSNENEDFISLTYLFTPELKINNGTREHKILAGLGQIPLYDDVMKNFYNKYQPEQYFKLVGEIGPTYVYELTDPTGKPK
jgi:hypothetical protein